MSFTIYPAIDIREGRIVRLVQGDYSAETRYGDNPLEQIEAYANAGAKWLHLVDLDAARAGGYTLTPLLKQIRANTQLNIQTGGGVRSRDDVAKILDAGVARVVIGSLAVREPKLVEQWLNEFGPDHLTIALDTRQDSQGHWRLPIHGWTETSEIALVSLAVRYANAGMQHLLCTDISRDGMLSGPNIDLYTHLTALIPNGFVQASGGVRELGDIPAARAANCAGIILGRALLEGRFTLQQALNI